jgi:transitional endoplasmic reticulum ATPase
VDTVVRAYQPEDLGQVLALWEAAGCIPVGRDGLTIDQVVDLMNSGTSATFVAEASGEVVGMAVGTAVGPVGRIERLVVTGEPTSRFVASELLDHLEARLVERGARSLAALVAADDAIGQQFAQRGYTESRPMRYLERRAPRPFPSSVALRQLGGRMIDPGLWDQLKGMEEAKAIIERRVILPLAEPDVAQRHAVAPPKAIVMFGPPGTGKTTFAKGIASRLGWPFIEIEPAQLGGEGAERHAKQLADTFELILELPSAVVFVDEVEDLASIRHQDRRASPSVTNEFLKQIPRFRQAPRHLLVCATNWVSRVDPAFLRPGRFDYVLPVGPPDNEARSAIWARYVAEITDEPLDVPALVAATGLFTPADIEFAARKAAQRAFEREHFEGISRRATAAEFLQAIGDTRPTLTEEMVESLRQDTAEFARY